MANIIRANGGSSAELTGTAQPSDVLKGQTFYNNNEEQKLTGTLALTGNASPSDVMQGRTFYNTNAKAVQTGTMANRGAISGSVGVGGSYTIPQGYHSGSGKVIGPTLSGNAAASSVLSGATFYSNSGTKQTGTMTNRGSWGATIQPGGSVTVPWGCHSGAGVVRASMPPAGTITLDGNNYRVKQGGFPGASVNALPLDGQANVSGSNSVGGSTQYVEVGRDVRKNGVQLLYGWSQANGGTLGHLTETHMRANAYVSFISAYGFSVSGLSKADTSGITVNYWLQKI